MDNFPANSQSAPGEKKKKDIQKVVSGEVILKQKGLGRRLRDIIAAAEFKNTTSYVISDVLIPAMKDTFLDAVNAGAKRAVHGDTSPLRRRSYGQDVYRPKVSYQTPVDRSPYSGARSSTRLPDQPPFNPRRRQDAGEIIFTVKAEADDVLERLSDIISDFDVATVADLHELVGLPSTHVDNKWGWTSVHHATVRQHPDGWLLYLAPAQPI